jgi:hypothetical protein
VEMSDGLMGVLDRSMVMAKGRRKPGDARGRFPFRSWWFVQPRGSRETLFRCKRRNSSSITAGADGGVLLWCKMATTTRWELGKTEIYLEGNVEMGMWQKGIIIIETINAAVLSCLFGKVTEPAHAHADGAPSIVSFKVGFGDLRITYLRE